MPDLDLISELSARLTALARDAAGSVVRVDGRRRAPASGVAFSADGLVVTTHHALERDEEVAVGLPSGDTVAAEVVGRDPTTDLAVLRAASGGLAPPPWAEPDGLEPGALVLELSRPGRGPRAALGMVARTAGLLRGTTMVIPAATLRRVVKALLAHGHVRRGYLGIATIPVPLPEASARVTGRDGALLVTAVEPESPAARAGVLLGDAILSVGGHPVDALSDLLPVLEEERIGDAVPLELLRAGEVRELQVTVGARERRRRER